MKYIYVIYGETACLCLNSSVFSSCKQPIFDILITYKPMGWGAGAAFSWSLGAGATADGKMKQASAEPELLEK